jgi:hypothetical protein
MEVPDWIGDEIHTRDHPGATPIINGFDPLHDRGDALGLAIQLHISISMFTKASPLTTSRTLPRRSVANLAATPPLRAARSRQPLRRCGMLRWSR